MPSSNSVQAFFKWACISNLVCIWALLSVPFLRWRRSRYSGMNLRMVAAASGLVGANSAKYFSRKSNCCVGEAPMSLRKSNASAEPMLHNRTRSA
jgi:hypothetical protein